MAELAFGHRGARVRELQLWLRRSGLEVVLAERQAEWFGPSTELALLTLQGRLGVATSGRLDRDGERVVRAHAEGQTLPEKFRVQGVVRRKDGAPVSGATVVVEDVDLFRAQELGRTHTNGGGGYEVVYARASFARAERLGPDLRVRVVVPSSDDLVSAILFNAGVDAVVDLVVGGGTYDGPAEWERVIGAVTPLVEGHSLSAIGPEHVAFLVGETAFTADVVGAFVSAVQIETKSAALGAPVPAEAAFAAIRQGAPSEVSSLGLKDDKQIRAWLSRAQGVYIANHGVEWVEKTAIAFTRLRERVGGKSRFGELGTVAGLSASEASLFAARYVEHRGQVGAFWSSLANDPALGPKVPALQRVSRLATVVLGHLPMVRALDSRFQQTQASSLGAFLGGIDEATWSSLADEMGAPTGWEPKDYAAQVASAVEDLFPTHVVLRHLPAHDLAEKEGVEALLLAHADQHNLAEEPVSTWAAKDSAPSDAVLLSAERVQRLYKVAGRAGGLGDLVSRGFSSAGEIARGGRGAFVDGAKDQAGADAVYERAVRQHEAAVFVWSRYDDHLNHAVGSLIGPPLPGRNGDSVPRHGEIFGSLAFCGCEECRSVYSPAAYLADILAFTESAHVVGALRLRDYLYSYNAGGTALHNRRADLGNIELTCENTNRILPTIDLVNELLEYVALAPAGVAAAGLPPVPQYQTTLTSEELIVSPEHIAAAAYDPVLAKAVYP